jgi:hypothetical protein
MVYNTQNCWVSGLYTSPGILNTRKHMVRKLDLFQSSGDEEAPTHFTPLERANH